MYLEDEPNIEKTRLSDLGKKSFLNSVLQCLVNIKELNQYFLNNSNTKNIYENIKEKRLSFAIQRLFYHCMIKQDKKYLPDSILDELSRKNIIFKQNHLEINPKYCLNFILEQLHCELNANKGNSNNLMFYKSNIFFDKEKEKINEDLDKIANEYKTQKEKQKQKYIELQHEKLVHPKIKRRKTNFLYNDSKKINPEDIEEYKKFHSNGVFQLEYANYKPKKEIIMKSLDNEYNARNKRLYIGLTEMERDTDKIVVLDISRNDKFDPWEIKNLFSKNGIHMFGQKTFNSYIENGKKGKFVFNIRKDANDKDYNSKLKRIQNYLMRKQGIVFNVDNRKSNYNKKVGNDIGPTFVGFKDFKSNRLNNLNDTNDTNEYQQQKIIKTTKVKIIKYH